MHSQKVFVLPLTVNRDGLNSPWGFRLKGGTDVDGGTPLEITKVFVGTGSEGVLYPGDKVVAINRQEASNLTHLEAQNLIKNSGTSVLLDVVRPGVQSLPTSGGHRQKQHSFSSSSSKEDYSEVSKVHNQGRQNIVSKTITVGDTQKKVVSAQFNSPLAMYSDETLIDSALQNNQYDFQKQQQHHHPGYVPSSKPKLPTSKDATFSRPHVSETFKIILESEMDKARDQKGIVGTEFRKESGPNYERSNSSMSNKSHDPLLMDDSISQSASFKKVMHAVLGESEI